MRDKCSAEDGRFEVRFSEHEGDEICIRSLQRRHPGGPNAIRIDYLRQEMTVDGNAATVDLRLGLTLCKAKELGADLLAAVDRIVENEREDSMIGLQGCGLTTEEMIAAMLGKESDE